MNLFNELIKIKYGLEYHSYFKMAHSYSCIYSRISYLTIVFERMIVKYAQVDIFN